MPIRAIVSGSADGAAWGGLSRAKMVLARVVAGFLEATSLTLRPRAAVWIGSESARAINMCECGSWKSATESRARVVLFGECTRELGTGVDVELLVGVGEVRLDGFRGDE